MDKHAFDSDSSPNNEAVIGPRKDTTYSHKYTGKKPKWWKKIAGRRGTKAQRAAISRMTELGHVIPKLSSYQHILNITELFATTTNTTALTEKKLLVPKEQEYQISTQANDKDYNVSLEIGFGSGDNLLTNAMMYPNRQYIGAEIHQPGLGTVLSRMEKAIESSQYWNQQTYHDATPFIPSASSSLLQPYENVRIYPGDGIKLLRFLPRASLDCIYLTFPDPWPKQNQFRVIQEETVREMGRVLKPGSGCFYLATDAICFDEWTRMIFLLVLNSNQRESDTEWQEIVPCPDRRHWLPAVSKYEEKGVNERRETMIQCWKRNSNI